MVRTENQAATRDLLAIWYLDEKILSEAFRQIKIHIYKNFYYSLVFSDKQKLFSYLSSGLVIKNIVFINSCSDEKEAKALETLVKRRPQCQGIYRFPLGKKYRTESLNHREIHRAISDLVTKVINHLQQPFTNIQQEENDNEAESEQLPPIFEVFKSYSVRNGLTDLNKEELKFLLFQSLIEIMLSMEYSKEDFDEMWNMCHEYCLNNGSGAEKIRNLAKTYKSGKAIECYTENSVLFRFLNKTLRDEDFEKIFCFGCYLLDLHKEIETLCTQQRDNERTTIKTLYRGKKCPADMIQQFKDSIGHLISLNGLVSTTKSYMTSRVFAGAEETQDDYHSVIFTFNIDPHVTKLIRPYAHISQCSVFPTEEEVLFFMGFVWKINDIQQENERTWHIGLQHCTDYNSELIAYIEEARKHCTLLSMGNISREMGDETSAANFYRRMLSSTTTDEIRGHVYFNMAVLAEDHGRFLDAEAYYKEASGLLPFEVPENQTTTLGSKHFFADSVSPSQLHLFNNMGKLYMKMEKRSCAREYFQKALEAKGSDIERATIFNNLARLELICRNITKALEYSTRAVELAVNDTLCSEFMRTQALIQQQSD